MQKLGWKTQAVHISGNLRVYPIEYAQHLVAIYLSWLYYASRWMYVIGYLRTAETQQSAKPYVYFWDELGLKRLHSYEWDIHPQNDGLE